MLPKKFRLTKDKDYKKVYRIGKFQKSQFFSLKFASNGSEVTRVGIVVSKKTASLVVARNKIKRRIREAVRLIYPQIKPGFDIIINTFPRISDINYQELEEDLKFLFKKAGIL